MRTNIVLDEKLVSSVMKLANVKTKREAVHVALDAFVRVKVVNAPHPPWQHGSSMHCLAA